MTNATQVHGKVNEWSETFSDYIGVDSHVTVSVTDDSDAIFINGRRSTYELLHDNGRWLVIYPASTDWSNPTNGRRGFASRIAAAKAWVQGEVDGRGGWLEDPIGRSR